MGTSITIVQLGDLHFDDFSTTKTANDTKDKTPPGGIHQAFERPISPIIATALSTAISNAPGCVVALCGDLTSKGSIPTYRDALEYLSTVIPTSARPPLDPDRLHLVPGNHDVDYGGAMPYANIGVERFTVLSDSVSASSYPGSLTTTSVSRVHSVGNASLSVISINSCRACGAPREVPIFAGANPLSGLIAKQLSIPESDLHDAIAKASHNHPTPNEILDIPLIHPDELSGLCGFSDNQPPSTLPVILAHHGFLPQALNRINQYTEMVNGGQVRESLLLLNRPLVYLHGHIHTDTVEIITGGTDENRDGGPVVVISAPEAKHGFNVIEVEFDSSGVPLGLVLRRHRLNLGNGQVRERAPQRIALARKRATQERFRPVIAYLNEKSIALGSDILHYLNKNIDTQVTKEELADHMSLLTWSGLVQIRPNTDELDFVEREYVFR